MRYLPTLVACALAIFVSCQPNPPAGSAPKAVTTVEPLNDQAHQPAPDTPREPQQPVPEPVSRPVTKRQSAPTPAPAPPAANPSTSTTEPQASMPDIPNHDSWNALLQKHVRNNGRVDYKGFQAEKQALIDYLQTLANHPPQSGWPRQEKMAYWINAYNAFTIELIVDHYPLKSILDLDGGKTWDVARILLGGKRYSLNEIENEILRPQFRDPRIHFALNCAARSCPPLWNHAFSAANLAQELDARTRAFINHPDFNTLGDDRCQVSKIFEWYAVDFGDLRAFLNRYAQINIPEAVAIAYKEYDWRLND